MRIDLSKVALVRYEDEEEVNGEAGFGRTRIIYSSHRIHTLLRQSDNRFSSNLRSGASRIEIKPEISKLTFLNVFDNHRPEEIEKLDRLFEDCKGILPSRRQLSAIAQSIGIQQSKIKKWFEKRIRDAQKAEPPVIIPSDSTGDSLFWEELWAKLDKIDDEISLIEANAKY